MHRRRNDDARFRTSAEYAGPVPEASDALAQAMMEGMA